jgi:hypothetical protein
MRVRRSVKYASAAAVALAAVGLWFLWHVSASAAEQTVLFTPDSRSVANRLYVQLHTRVAPDGKEYGIDSLDPLLWSETNYLLEGKKNREALALADEFLRTHAERQVTDPLRRAILQRDIWAVYDWAAASSRTPRAGGQAGTDRAAAGAVAGTLGGAAGHLCRCAAAP